MSMRGILISLLTATFIFAVPAFGLSGCKSRKGRRRIESKCKKRCKKRAKAQHKKCKRDLKGEQKRACKALADDTKRSCKLACKRRR